MTLSISIEISSPELFKAGKEESGTTRPKALNEAVSSSSQRIIYSPGVNTSNELTLLELEASEKTKLLMSRSLLLVL